MLPGVTPAQSGPPPQPPPVPAFGGLRLQPPADTQSTFPGTTAPDTWTMGTQVEYQPSTSTHIAATAPHEPRVFAPYAAAADPGRFFVAPEVAYNPYNAYNPSAGGEQPLRATPTFRPRFSSDLLSPLADLQHPAGPPRSEAFPTPLRLPTPLSSFQPCLPWAFPTPATPVSLFFSQRRSLVPPECVALLDSIDAPTGIPRALDIVLGPARPTVALVDGVPTLALLQDVLFPEDLLAQATEAGLEDSPIVPASGSPPDSGMDSDSDGGQDSLAHAALRILRWLVVHQPFFAPDETEDYNEQSSNSRRQAAFPSGPPHIP
ncbi:hypothetical protein HPB47_018019 [Ixodes persulcatus]|uniref:Uncharacterized protein n=1 Tax=Ixodes persulcatus TaxID=34615 RepID=A0AC60QMS8_IXOPE|nr:hypothetical protein HPB47_018019 [Ixodes persulcatus]